MSRHSQGSSLYTLRANAHFTLSVPSIDWHDAGAGASKKAGEITHDVRSRVTYSSSLHNEFCRMLS